MAVENVPDILFNLRHDGLPGRRMEHRRPSSFAWVGPDYLSDWILLPVSDYRTTVESTTWGQVKASFRQ